MHARVHDTSQSVQRAGDVYVSAETLRSMIMASQDVARPIRQLKPQFASMANSTSPTRSRRPGTTSTIGGGGVGGDEDVRICTLLRLLCGRGGGPTE